MACEALNVSRSGFYAYRRRGPSDQARRREVLAARIQVVFVSNRYVYGSPRIHQTLLAQGEKVSQNTVAKCMRELELKARVKQKYVPRTTDSDHGHRIAGNVLDRRFACWQPNTKWVCDMTYIPTGEGWMYLAAVLDLCSRKIVGWSMADHMEASLVGDALTMAIDRRRPGAGLLHHSDRGVQYACDDYRKLLDRAGMELSMSGKGDCWDNAAMESFWSTLKTELVHHEHYATRESARASIFEYIEVFYNRKRLHSTLGYQSTEAFEPDLN